MGIMHSEYRDRINHWIRTLKEDFYTPVGTLNWEVFKTMGAAELRGSRRRNVRESGTGIYMGEDLRICVVSHHTFTAGRNRGKESCTGLMSGRRIHGVCEWSRVWNIPGGLGEAAPSFPGG